MDGHTKQVLLAAGAAELLMRIPIEPEYREAIWDQAAGALLVGEAGGRVTDLDSLPLAHELPPSPATHRIRRIQHKARADAIDG